MDARPHLRSYSHVLWLAAACLPFVLSMAAQARGTSPQPVAPSVPRAGLAFEQYLVDLGAVGPSEEVFARFGFVNRGTSPVTIGDYQASCGCLQPQLSKKVYQPHEMGEFLLRVKTANQESGPKEYRLTVKYEDERSREVDLVFRVVLPDNQVVVRPRALICYQLSGQPTRQEVVVTDRREKPLSLVAVQSSLPIVKPQLGELGVDENGHWQQRISIEVAGDVTGRVQGMLTILTNDATYPELRVPLLIEGRRPSSGLAQRLPMRTSVAPR